MKIKCPSCRGQGAGCEHCMGFGYVDDEGELFPVPEAADIWHITIAGKPACLRGSDPEELWQFAAAHKVPLMCSYRNKDDALAAASMYKIYYRDVAVVNGGCTAEW